MNTHIWRYQDNQRNYPGYHLCADEEACVALLAWLRNPKKKTGFQLQPVTQEVLNVPNNQGGLAAHVSCTQLKFQTRTNVDPRYFLFSEESGRLTLDCSQQQEKLVIKGVEDIMRGEGDYSIGTGKNQALWFWWYPRQQTAKMIKQTK
jgi:hypothetical protein